MTTTDCREEGFRSVEGVTHDIDDKRHEVAAVFPHEVLDSL